MLQLIFIFRLYTSLSRLLSALPLPRSFLLRDGGIRQEVKILEFEAFTQVMGSVCVRNQTKSKVEQVIVKLFVCLFIWSSLIMLYMLRTIEGAT